MKKTMIDCLKAKAEQMGYDLTLEDIFAFERECLDVCSIRAGGITLVDDYLEDKGLKHAYEDYEKDADDTYYDEFIEIRSEVNKALSGIESDPDYYRMSEEDYIEACEREYAEACAMEDTAYNRACELEGRVLTNEEYEMLCEAFPVDIPTLADDDLI